MVEPYKILFIAGVGRSGSTIASILLAQSEDVINIGEIGNLWRDGFDKNILCGCGERYHNCEFWPSVVEDVFGSFDNIPTQELKDVRRLVWTNMPTMPMLLTDTVSGKRKQALERYRDVMRQMYTSIVKISGKRVVIDASKHAIHGLHLASIPEAELHVLHWIRDSRAVAFSALRKKRRKEVLDKEVYLAQRNIWKSSILWDMLNSFCMVLKAQGYPNLTVRYEDFVTNPRIELKRMIDFIGLSDDVDTMLDLHGEDVVQSHSILGNPARFSSKLEIRADFEWKEALPAWKKTAVTAMTSPLLARYGYLSD